MPSKTDNSYPHMCQDEHVRIGHSDSEHERCPLCRALDHVAALEARLKELEIELESAQNTIRAYDGLVALKNGIPETTGDAVFDKVLAVYPVAEMIQRGWLGSATGFADLPFLEKQLCRFFEAGRLADLLNEDFFKEPAPDSAPVGGKE